MFSYQAMHNTLDIRYFARATQPTPVIHYTLLFREHILFFKTHYIQPIWNMELAGKRAYCVPKDAYGFTMKWRACGEKHLKRKALQLHEPQSVQIHRIWLNDK